LTVQGRALVARVRHIIGSRPGTKSPYRLEPLALYTKFRIMTDRELDFWDGDGRAFRETVKGWPDAVKKAIGGDLRRVQRGEEPLHGKPLKGFAVKAYEVKHRGGARVVYSVAFVEISGRVFIVDAFMKDSRDGNEMRIDDKKRIEDRLKKYRSKYVNQNKRLH